MPRIQALGCSWRPDADRSQRRDGKEYRNLLAYNQELGLNYPFAGLPYLNTVVPYPKALSGDCALRPGSKWPQRQ